MELQSIQISVFLKKEMRHLILVRAEQLFFKKHFLQEKKATSCPGRRAAARG